MHYSSQMHLSLVLDQKTRAQVDDLVATDYSLLKACEDCFMVKTGEIDQVPGQSTEFFSFMTDDEESLKSELRSRISKLI